MLFASVQIVSILTPPTASAQQPAPPRLSARRYPRQDALPDPYTARPFRWRARRPPSPPPGRGRKARLAAQHRGRRFRRQSGRLRAHGRRATRLDRHRRAQGARGGASFRRPTRASRNPCKSRITNTSLTLDGIIASRGGIPSIVDGKLIGAIGCSGGTGSQDEVVCYGGRGRRSTSKTRQKKAREAARLIHPKQNGVYLRPWRRMSCNQSALSVAGCIHIFSSASGE